MRIPNTHRSRQPNRASHGCVLIQTPGEDAMNSIIYIVGLVVIVMAVLSFIGLN